MKPPHTWPIALPQWYARFAPGRVDETVAPTHDAVQLGPITVFRSDSGGETATIGAHGRTASVLFDGYLFDRDALAGELGLSALAASNAELAAAAYERWGSDVFDRLDGCYLLAIWDAGRERLFLGHDALGRHPIFYAAVDGALWFSPNVLALVSSGCVPRDVNRLSVALLIVFLWPEGGQTFFERVHRVRPGHYLEVTPALDLAERMYWHPFPEDDEPWHPDAGVVERFEEELTKALHRCMQLDPQGIMLSGGLDSVTVAALAADYGRSHDLPPLVAVSGQTGHAMSAEERRQGIVATALKMPHRVSTTAEWEEGRDPIELSLEATPELPSPSRIYWVGTYAAFYRRTASERLNVLLTGAGGDNWLGVAAQHAADLIGRLQLLSLARFMAAEISTGGGSVSGTFRHLLWTNGLRLHVDSCWARLAPVHKRSYHRRKWLERLPVWLCPDAAVREELVECLLDRRMPARAADGRAPASYYRHSLRSLSNPYMHYENEIAYHVEHSCGLRLLSPYHDRRFVSFANRISPRALVHGNRYKGLLRPIIAKRLPGLGLERQRKDYPSDDEARLQRELRESVAAAWPRHRLGALAQLGLVDLPRIEDGWPGRAADPYEPHIRRFILMSADLWTRAHGPSA